MRMYAVRKIDVRNSESWRDDSRYSVSVARGGKPISGLDAEKITSIEQEVMRWDDATHIHNWFINHLHLDEDDHKRHELYESQLRELLQDCEQVLNGTHLVREKAFKASDYSEISRRMEPSGTPPKVIKNVSVAHKLLPVKSFDCCRAGEYDEEYLKVVEATRDWAERMLMDSKNGVPGTIYYGSKGY